MSAKKQIKALADYIMFEIPGEPSHDEGAVACAIRLLGEYQAVIRRCQEQVECAPEDYEEQLDRYRSALSGIMSELGVQSYPTPVANAWEIARVALGEDQAAGAPKAEGQNINIKVQRAEQFAEDMFDSAARMEAMRKLTGEELADAILDNDWADCDFCSPQSDFWECVIEKLRRHDSIERTASSFLKKFMIAGYGKVDVYISALELSKILDAATEDVDFQLCPYEACGWRCSLDGVGWYVCPNCFQVFFAEGAEGDYEDYHLYPLERAIPRGATPPRFNIPVARSCEDRGLKE